MCGETSLRLSETPSTSVSNPMRITDISVTQQMEIMLQYFDNTLCSVHCVFFKLESIERATAKQLFVVIDKHIQQPGPLSYEHLICLGQTRVLFSYFHQVGKGYYHNSSWQCRYRMFV